MKILFLHSGSDLYGASRCLLRLAAALVREGFTVEAWVPSSGPLVPRLEAAGVSAAVVPELTFITRDKYRRKDSLLRFLTRSSAALPALVRRIKAANPDLIHSNTAVLAAAGLAARLSGVPHVWHVREWFGEFPAAWRLYQWHLYACADRILCVSHAVARQFAASARGKIRVLHDGFPPEEFAGIAPEQIRAFRHRFSLDGRITAGVVGRIKWKRKGQDNFLRAVSLLPPDLRAARFLCIGSPFPGNEDHLRSLTRLAAEEQVGDEWQITGDVVDNLAAVASLDILVHPAGQPEPFSGAVIEAMALSKPVIGTNLGGTAEQVDHGVTGFLVPPDDPPALARALETLLRDESLRASMGAAGRRRFQERFTWDPFFHAIRTEYAAMLKCRPTAA